MHGETVEMIKLQEIEDAKEPEDDFGEEERALEEA
jgi:hypothetical protein